MEIRLLKDFLGRVAGENISVSTDRAYHLMAIGIAAEDKGFMGLYEAANHPAPEKPEPKPEPEPEAKKKPKVKKQ